MATLFSQREHEPAVSGIRAFVARLLDNFIFGALLVWITLAAIPYGTVEPWAQGLFEVGIFALTALWMIEGWLSRRWFVGEHRLLIPLLFIALYMCVQLVPYGTETIAGVTVHRTMSVDPYDTRLVLAEFGALVLLAAMLWRYTSSPRRLRAVIFVIIGIGMMSALFGIARQALQHEEVGFFLPRLRRGDGYGQFINRNHFAVLMEMSLGVTLGLIVAKGIRRESFLIYIALAVPLWAALVLSNSRGGIFSMLTQMIFLAFAYRRRKDEHRMAAKDFEAVSERTARWRVRIGAIRIVAVICLLIGVGITALWIGGEPLSSRLGDVPGELQSETTESENSTGRLSIWRWTAKLIKDHPISGVGFGAYNTAITKYHTASGEYAIGEAHNDYLELMASGGIVAVVLVALWFVMLSKDAARAWRSRDAFRHAACVGAMAGILSVMVHSMVEFGLHVTVNACAFVALIVIATLRERTRATIENL
ncbi:MAG: O-antigen ligase [Pyrinomonadaceae bacterium]